LWFVARPYQKYVSDISGVLLEPIDAAHQSLADKVAVAQGRAREGTTLIRSILDTTEAGGDAQWVLDTAQYAQGLLTGEVAYEGTTLPGAMAAYGENADTLRAHLDTIHERSAAMIGRIAAVREAIGMLASNDGPLEIAKGAVTTYSNSL
jgi:hypothetical protein